MKPNYQPSWIRQQSCDRPQMGAFMNRDIFQIKNSGPWCPRGLQTSSLIVLALGVSLFLINPFSRANAAQGGPAATPAVRPSIVLVPGGYEDGSIWTKVIARLQAKGFQVTVVPIPLTSLAADVAMTRSILVRQAGPVILVGHSWGGVVITEAGSAPNVIGLVYIAAVAPEAGEGSGDVLQRCSKHAPFPIKTDEAGMKWIDPAGYPAVWAADLDPAEARILASVQRPVSTASFTDKVTEAAWHTKPSWFQVSSQDIAQCPEMQRYVAKRMGATTIELNASHASPLSHPEEVTKLIVDAAEAASRAKGVPAVGH
jgi:pimeloyl-ACP methyl ester carboxylesterase